MSLWHRLFDRFRSCSSKGCLLRYNHLGTHYNGYLAWNDFTGVPVESAPEPGGLPSVTVA